ncbi:MAG: hypothetical protein WCB09_12695, partial [Methylocella sp.]
MLVRRSLLLGFSMASAVFGLVLSSDSWAQDVRHLCSEKYQAAKAAGTLNGESWPQFYSRCTAEAKANPAAAAPAAAALPDARHICSEKYQAAKAAGTLNGETWPQFYSRCTTEATANPPAAAAAPAAAAHLDTRHICSEKYQAAKAAGTLNGETWPQFYSKCVAETKANPPAAEVAQPPAPVVAAPPLPAPVVEAPTPPPPAPAPVV